MPELPEVETVARGLAAHILGKRVVAVVPRRPDLRVPFPEHLTERLTGRRVETITRRGKYILITFDEGLAAILHLGMTGQLLVAPPGTNLRPLQVHDHLILNFEDGTEVRFHDERRFGLLALTDASRLHQHPLLTELGLEPLSDAFTAKALSTKLGGRMTSIKSALMNQHIVAGLGNIYVCESLFRAGISPWRSAGSVAGGPTERLVPAIRATLNEAIAAGGSTLRNYVQASGEIGSFQNEFAVYGLEGAPCPGCTCSPEDIPYGVQRTEQSGRSTYFCPRRQR